MKQTSDKRGVQGGQNVLKRFTIPSSKKKNPGLNQGVLLMEIFTAANREISKVVKQNNLESVVATSRQILFFANVLPGDYIQVSSFVVRKNNNIKITVSLQKFSANGETEIATGKFLYTVQ